jgi:hypothetical protein
MPRAPARIRKRFIEGQTEVLDWCLEDELVFGTNRILGPSFGQLCRLDDWRAAWDRWRDTIMPKVIEYRPGTRPVAAYVCGEIPQRELRMPPPNDREYWHVDVIGPSGQPVRHWLDVPEPFMESEVKHLHGLGIVDDDEYRRHREWMQTSNPDCDRCVVDLYPSEMSLHD